MLRSFGDEAGRRVVAIYIGLILVNVGAWIWALLALRGQAVLMGTALAAYGFGLRHAVDADHIAAIDNVTRRLMQRGQRPVSVGLFFALGHSSMVVLACLVVALTSAALTSRLRGMQEIGATVSTCVSFGFLWLIAALNLLTLRRTYATLKAVRSGLEPGQAELEAVLAQQGVLSRWLRPLYNLMGRSWHMFALGLLFGLGFETATEVLLLGLSAEQGAHGMSLWSIMLFPVLFTAGMTLIDTSDGVLMVGAYGWAFVDPVRKLYYNIIVTALSAAIAVFVGGLEILTLFEGHVTFAGPVWNVVEGVSHHLGSVGYIVIALFLAIWLLSMGLYRKRTLDSGL